jgi:hypothetical protein
VSSEPRPVNSEPVQPLADTWGDLAGLLTRLRGDTSLERLVSQQAADRARIVPSTSTLSRYETGRTRPPLKMAEHLDALYRAEGVIEMSLRSLWRARWNPWGEHEARLAQQHAFSWPGPYEGAVWVRVVPHVDHVGRAHSIRLAWGPWRHAQTLVLPERGVVLRTGKAADEGGIPVTMNMDSDLPVFSLSGLGDDLTAEDIVDIRAAWHRV